MIFQSDSEREIYERESATLAGMTDRREAERLIERAVLLERYRTTKEWEGDDDKEEVLPRRSRAMQLPENWRELVERVWCEACRACGIQRDELVLSKADQSCTVVREYAMTVLYAAFNGRRAGEMLGMTDAGIGNGVFRLKRKHQKLHDRARELGKRIRADIEAAQDSTPSVDLLPCLCGAGAVVDDRASQGHRFRWAVRCSKRTGIAGMGDHGCKQTMPVYAKTRRQTAEAKWNEQMHAVGMKGAA